MIIKLKTRRLVLKPANKSYARQCLNYLRRNKKFFKPWTPAYADGYFTIREQTRDLVAKMRSFKEELQIKFFIFKKSNLDIIIGDFEFGSIVKGPFLSCYLGYKLDKDEIKKGYMVEALEGGIKYMFEKIGLHRIEANIMPRNKPSVRLARRLGFKYEGKSKKYLKINGKWEDHLHYVLLNPKM